jgi:uracil-DNA glycosylase family 4
MGVAETMKEIALQVSECKKCILKDTRKHSVPGEGPVDARVMLIGEGPGFHENEQGKPFVGAAGKYLDDLLRKGGLSRSTVFITNVVKCRPPGNRDPLPDELEACSFYLDHQIETLNPLVIVTLGRFSMARYMPNAKISAVHAKPLWVNKRLIIPMYHPAAALHQPALKSALESDFARLSEWISEASKAVGPAPDIVLENGESNQKGEPTQMGLF